MKIMYGGYMIKKELLKCARKSAKMVLVFTLSLSLVSCTNSKSGKDETTSNTTQETEKVTDNYEDPPNTDKYLEYADMSVEEIVDSMTLEQKAAQMTMIACYNVNEDMMRDKCYGCILSKMDVFNYKEWQDYIRVMQEAAVSSESGIPFIYGQDDVHGVNYAKDTVIFPHNIGMGAAGDEDLMYEIGKITADEAKLCHMLWNYSPCLAQSVDPRWGRTYESYGSDLEMIKKLGSSYIKGVQDGGVVACAKHFFADGNVGYGTGEKDGIDMLIDRGDATLTGEEINDLLDVYQHMIDAGVKTIMVSHSSVNGVKMHENGEYIWELKNEMGFEGYIAGDWGSVSHTSPSTYKEQVITSVNSGIDMLMEVDTADEVINIIVNAVEDGDITEDRVNDAVSRIIKVKKEAGLFDDPYMADIETEKNETGSDEYREVATKAVEESLVLLKNEGDVLPLKRGSSIYVMGPAAEDNKAQCGGWTLDWNESSLETIPGLTTLKDGFIEKAQDANITVITDEEKAGDADVIVLCVGEQSYAEWNGDAENMDLCGDFALDGNAEAIEKAKSYGKPIVTCIVAGRNVFIKDYIDDFDATVMCYLPGSEGEGVANVLYGLSSFSGKLPSPWYSSNEDIDSKIPWLEKGFGLEYK